MAKQAQKTNPATVNRHDDEVALDLFNKVVTELKGKDLNWVADDAKVSLATLYYWLNGDTLLPYTRTLFRVATTLGFKVTMTKRRSIKVPNRLRVVK